MVAVLVAQNLIISTAQEVSSCEDLTAGNCMWSPDCLELDCMDDVAGQKAVLSVSNCEDPVKVQLVLHSSSQQCSRTYAVSGDGHYSEVALDGKLLNVIHARNASHLHFFVSNKYCRSLFLLLLATEAVYMHL